MVKILWLKQNIDMKGFKRKPNLEVGDVARMTDIYWHGDLGESRDDIGKLFVIKEVHGGKYSIISMEDGSSSAWWYDSQLEFVRKGEPNILEELKKKREEIINRTSNLKWIKENFKYELSTTSILKLFEEINYNSSFLINGEYFILFDEWANFYPIFENIFKGDLLEAIEYTKKVFKEEYVSKYVEGVNNLYNKIEKL